MGEGFGRDASARDGLAKDAPARDGLGPVGFGPVAGPARFGPFLEADERPADDGPLALLRSIFQVLRRRRWALLAWMALFIGGAALHAFTQPPVFGAAAQLLLEPRRAAVGSPREAQAPPTLDPNRADSELQVIRSERLLAEVFDSLSLADDPDLAPAPRGPLRSLLARLWNIGAGWALAWIGESPALPAIIPSAGPAPAGQAPPRSEPSGREAAFANFASRLSARRVGQSYVIEIAYAAGDPRQAARVANAAASAYLRQSIAFKVDAARSGGEFLQGRVDALAAQVQAAEAAVRAGALPELPTPDADARVIGAALPPLSAAAPQKTLIVAFGGALGLISALFAAAVAGALDRKVRDQARLARETGLDCLALVPEVRSRRGFGRLSELEMQRLVKADFESRYSASIHDLRVALRLSAPAQRADGRQIIAFASPRRGAGSSTLCMNLAQLMKRAPGGSTVIDADVKGGTGALSGRFAYGSGALVDVLTGSSRLDQLVVINVEGVALVPTRSADAAANLAVDFADPRLGQILAMARARGDVLIDLPPVLEGAEARLLARQADAVVIVVSASGTALEDVAEAERLLRQAGARVAGAVINRASS
jgi:Mrp family chromosome partitioning ATPase/capsular polysaccharide biosynthesis protein